VPGANASTILDALAIRARDTPQVVAYTVDAEAITYGQLLDNAEWMARRLASAGLSPGDRCALILPTCPDFVRAIFGVQMAGAAPVGIDFNLPIAGQCRRLRQVRPAVILTTTGHAARFSIADVASFPGRVVTLDSLKTLGPARLWPASAPQPGDAAYLQLTSGTTGDPRAAIVSHRALLQALAGYEDRFDMRPKDIMVSWLPLHHAGGLVRFVFGAVRFGCVTHLIQPSAGHLSRWIELMSLAGATITSAPDFAYRVAARARSSADVNLRGLRLATSASESVRATTIAAFERRFGLDCVVQPGYGLTETIGLVSSPGAGEPLRTDSAGRVSCGPPLAGIELRIRGDDGGICAPGCEGEILVRSHALFDGYFGDAAGTDEVLRGGWFHTGDVGTIDGAGHLYPRSRARAMIKRAGATISPREIEEAVEQLDGVLGAAAVGVERSGSQTEAVVVVVEASGPFAGGVSALAARVEASVAGAVGFVPDQVLVVPPSAIPRSSSGKVQHATLQGLVNERRFLDAALFAS
jgi:fatty-acyl-CoA synthase